MNKTEAIKKEQTPIEMLKEIRAWLSFNTEPKKHQTLKLVKDIKKIIESHSPTIGEEDVREPIQNAIYSTGQVNQITCTILTNGIVEYLKDAGFEIIKSNPSEGKGIDTPTPYQCYNETQSPKGRCKKWCENSNYCKRTPKSEGKEEGKYSAADIDTSKMAEESYNSIFQEVRTAMLPLECIKGHEDLTNCENQDKCVYCEGDGD